MGGLLLSRYFWQYAVMHLGVRGNFPQCDRGYDQGDGYSSTRDVSALSVAMVRLEVWDLLGIPG